MGQRAQAGMGLSAGAILGRPRKAPRSRTGSEAIPDSAAQPRSRRPRGCDSLVVLDSEGTVLDSMDDRHELCFMPLFVSWFGLGEGRDEVRGLEEVWRFVNLRSGYRGANRFRALARALRLASRHPLCARAGRKAAPLASALEAWLSSESAPSSETLCSALVEGRAGARLARVLAWSSSADETLVLSPPARPFAGALEALPLMARSFEILVVAACPEYMAVSDWEGAGISAFANSFAGWERGSKSICVAASLDGIYPPERILFVGDAPEDRDAALALGASFYPIVPGAEELSWERLVSGHLERFASGSRIAPPLADFLAAQLRDPPWLARRP